MASGTEGFRGEEAQAREGAGQHGVTEGHSAGSHWGSSCSVCCMPQCSKRPQPDYCTGIQPQSVFIRERAKIIQEGSGPLIHLKRRMKGRGEKGEVG